MRLKNNYLRRKDAMQANFPFLGSGLGRMQITDTPPNAETFILFTESIINEHK